MRADKPGNKGKSRRISPAAPSETLPPDVFPEAKLWMSELMSKP